MVVSCILSGLRSSATAV